MTVVCRELRKGFKFMTRKQALNAAITELSKYEEFIEVVALLSDIHDDLPLVHWSDKSIRDTIEQFVIDNGRNPTVTDFMKKGMPSHMVMKRKYKVNLGEWLAEHYPIQRPSFDELKNKYTKQFIEDYIRIRPSAQERFNENRGEGTVTWQTVAKYHGVDTWRKLINKIGLPVYHRPKNDRVPVKIEVNIYTDYDFKECC